MGFACAGWPIENLIHRFADIDGLLPRRRLIDLYHLYRRQLVPEARHEFRGPGFDFDTRALRCPVLAIHSAGFQVRQTDVGLCLWISQIGQCDVHI